MSGANYLQFVAGNSSFCPERSPEKSKARLLKPTEKTVEIDVEQRMGNDLLPNMDLPRGWQLEITHSNLACIYRRDPLEFNGQRLTLELELDLSSRDNRKFIIKSQVFKVEFTTLMSNASIVGLSLHEQINYILEYLQNSTVCRGISLQEGETIISLTPHFTGDMEELSGSKGKESRAFSAKCLVISTGNDAQCKNCKILKKVNSQRVARRESRTFDTPDARSNKKFLSKEEVVRQLSEKNSPMKHFVLRKRMKLTCQIFSPPSKRQTSQLICYPCGNNRRKYCSVPVHVDIDGTQSKFI